MSTLEKKVIISLGSTFLFTLVNIPDAYKFTSFITKLNLFDFVNKCRTNLGFMVHTIVFFLITYFSMGNPVKEIGIKLKRSIYGTLIYYMLSSPSFYSLFTDKCPNMFVIVISSIVYFITLVGLMYLPKE